ncbi:hypothetical protein, conserved [Leishmania tarentolae]|uniref:Uncharacterized protein n=1 Tax=Leishmania tarentolae TaxID=5689 RepID=A0A640K7F3_LEITA|nr:hypothetical protein, conserved [Leishmania tarentolae]
MASITDGADEVTSAVVDAAAPARGARPQSSPPLASSADAQPQLQRDAQGAPDAEQQDAPLPPPLPASPMTRRRKWPLSATGASAHYLTATTAAIARSRSPRGSVAAHPAATTSSAPLAPTQRRRTQRPRSATDATSPTTSSPPLLKMASVSPPRGSAVPSVGDRCTSAFRALSSPPQKRCRQPETARRPAAATKRVSSSTASPHHSLIEAVLDDQYATEPSSQQQAAATTGASLGWGRPTVGTVFPSKRQERGGGVAVAPQRQHHTPRRAHRLALTDLTKDGPDDTGDSEDGNEAVDSALAPPHQALRLQPLPPVAPASVLIEEATLVGGDDSGPVETLADVVTVAPTQARAATPSALAAERASLLYDSSCAVMQHSPSGRMRTSDDTEAYEHLWRPTTEPRVVPPAFSHTAAGVVATHGHTSVASSRAPNPTRMAKALPTLPAAVVEFLKAEADAEVAVKGTTATAVGAADDQRRALSTQRSRDVAGARADASSTSRPTATLSAAPPLLSFPPVLSPAAESAAVLRELEDVQRRLRAHGHRLRDGEAAAGAAPSDAKAHTQAPETRSPCGISGGASSASSTATTASSSSAARKQSEQHGRNRIVGLRHASSEYWTTASLTEIVDHLDGQCAATFAQGRRKQQRQRSRADFDPAAYARRLLDTAAHSCTSSTASDDDDGAYTDGGDAGCNFTGLHRRAEKGIPNDEDCESAVRSHDCRSRSASPASCSLSPATLKREALLRSGPPWATAAAELGLTPAEVQDLLRYSLSSPDAAATWHVASSSPLHHGKRVVGAAVDKNADDGGQRCAGLEKKYSSSSSGAGGSPSDVHRCCSHPLPSASLDVATQTALVQRIVAAMPVIPAELQDELSRQRRLLERVCRDVSCMSVPAHAAVRARLASPTVSSAAARQPSPMEFSTGASRGGAQRSPSAAADTHDMPLRHEEEEQLFLASLPRPAVQALKAVSGLRGTAADLSRSLPPFHAVVARPTLYPASQTPVSTTGNDTALPREPYEIALHELAERETRHYVSELDRLRTMYDHHLQEERRQRQQERRHYAELLQSQQHKMLRHHRETVHLLQRECRLQQQQQESLVQQLAASQAAAAQRQQARHEQTTKHMLAGAVDVMKSYAMAEGVGRSRQAEMAAPDAVAVTSRGMSKQRRQRPRVRFDSAASGGSRSKRIVGSPASSPAALHYPDDSDTSEAGRMPKASPVEETSAATVAALTVHTPPRPSTYLPAVGVTSRMGSVDADIPTAEHAISPKPASSTAHRAFSSVSSLSVSPSRSTLTSPPRLNAAESDSGQGLSAHHSTPPSAPAAVADATLAEQCDGQSTAAITLSVAPSVSARAPRPAAAIPAGVASARAGPSTNTPEMLRAVYGSDVESPPRRPPTRARMALPLRVRLPPEDDTPTRQRVGVAALEAELSDVRAAAAARDAGLAEGTRLYGVVPRRPRLSHPSPPSNTGEATVERLNQAAPRRALSASPSSSPSKQHARTADGEHVVGSSAELRRSGSGRGRGGRGRKGKAAKVSGTSMGRRGRRTTPHTIVDRGSGGFADRGRWPLLRRFDTEVVSVLSSEAETAPSHGHPLQRSRGTSVPNMATSATPYESSVALHDGVTSSRGAVHELADYRGTWSESMHVDGQDVHGGAVPRQEAVDAAVRDAGVTAGAPAIRRPHVLVTQPAGSEVATVTCATRITGAAASSASCFPQAVDAQLRAALHHRTGVVRELHQRTSSRSPSAHNDQSAGDGEGRAVLHAAGSLPPCDSVFFGAQAEVLMNVTDSGAVGDDGEEAAPSSLGGAPVPLRMLSDYTRAWVHYAAAEREVESHAQALAAEDAGVLEAVSVAEKHCRRGQGEDDGAASAVAVTTLHPLSTAAAVCYRERELGYGDPALRGGSAHVSPRMTAEARALTQARRRMAAIRACFIAPPSLDTTSALGGASMGRVTGGLHTALQDAALTRELVDAAMLSVLQAEHQEALVDPVQQVMTAMEHEILHLMLIDCLEERVEATSGAATEERAPLQQKKSQQQRLDAEFAHALAEATLEDAVHAALERSCREKKVREAATTSSDAAAAATIATKTATVTLTDASSAAELDLHEHVLVPRTSSTAWLHDDPPQPEAVLQQEAAPPPTDVGDAERKIDAITATATVVLPPPRGDSHDASSCGAPQAADRTPQEVRVVVDLSPVVRDMIISRHPAAATSMPSYDWQQQQQQQRLHYPPPHPPIQQEQLPSRWMALEDRRDVIVEAEGPLVVTETRAEKPGEHTSAPAPSTDGGGLPSAALSTPPLPVVCCPAANVAAMPGPAAVVLPPPTPQRLVVGGPDLPSAHVHAATASPDLTNSHGAPQLTLLHLLQSTLLDQEQLQRASLADHEEEQRRAYELLREVAQVAAEQRASTTPAAAAALLSPSAAVIPTTQAQLASSPQHVASAVAEGTCGEHVGASETAMSELSAPSRSQPPPFSTHATSPSSRATPLRSLVRDPVMGFVLEWVRQFGALQQQQPSVRGTVAATSSASLMEGLTAAARTAAMHDATPPAQAADHRSLSGPFRRYAASRPSTRNLGSSTATTSSSLPSPSLPSSLHTRSSSSSSSFVEDERWGHARMPRNWHSDEQRMRMPHRIASGEPLEAVPAYLCAPARKTRPVLDTQRDDTSACTATTRYTTGRSSVALAVGNEWRDGRGVPSGSSCLLPPRASAEVQAAMAAALRAHQQASHADASTAAPAVYSRLGAADVSLGSPVGNSSYDVSLPARSAETTAATEAPSPRHTAAVISSSNPAKLRAPSPTWSATTREDAWTPVASRRTSGHIAGTVVVVGPRDAGQQRTTQPRPRSPLRTAGWACVSLTSTSTSSHSDERGGSGRKPNQVHAAQSNGFVLPAASEAAPAPSTRSFITARGRDAPKATWGKDVSQAPMSAAHPLPTTATAVPMQSSRSSRHNRSDLLQAQVLRIQQEQRARKAWHHS